MTYLAYYEIYKPLKKLNMIQLILELWEFLNSDPELKVKPPTE